MRMRRAVRRTSIVDSFHKPALSVQVLADAIERGLLLGFPALFRSYPRPQRAHFHVPFLACPRGLGPPAAFRFPGSGKRKNLSAHSLASEIRRFVLARFHHSRKRRPVNSHGRCWALLRGGPSFLHFRQDKPVLPKRLRTMRIEQYRSANPAFPDGTLNSREGDFQTFRIGRERQEKSQLSGARLARNRQHANRDDRQRWRVRFEVQLQKLQKQFAVPRRNRKAKRSDMKDGFFSS